MSLHTPSRSHVEEIGKTVAIGLLIMGAGFYSYKNSISKKEEKQVASHIAQTLNLSVDQVKESVIGEYIGKYVYEYVNATDPDYKKQLQQKIYDIRPAIFDSLSINPDCRMRIMGETLSYAFGGGGVESKKLFLGQGTIDQIKDALVSLFGFSETAPFTFARENYFSFTLSEYNSGTLVTYSAIDTNGCSKSF